MERVECITAVETPRATAQIKLSRTAARLAETTGSDTAPITRTLSFRASEGGVMATVGTIRPGVAAESETQSIELSAIDFQLLKTQLSTVCPGGRVEQHPLATLLSAPLSPFLPLQAIPWLTGWMQQLNPLTYDEATHAASSWGERAQTYRGSGPV